MGRSAGKLAIPAKASGLSPHQTHGARARRAGERSGEAALRCASCRAAALAIKLTEMRNEFTAIIERDGDWFIAQCPEVPEANGQGRTPEEAKSDLAAAIELVLEVRREDALKAAAADAVREIVTVGT